MIVTFLKTSFAGLIMAVAVLLSYSKLTAISSMLALIVSVGTGAMIYISLVFVLKVDACDYVIDIVKKKLKRK